MWHRDPSTSLLIWRISKYGDKSDAYASAASDEALMSSASGVCPPLDRNLAGQDPFSNATALSRRKRSLG